MNTNQSTDNVNVEEEEERDFDVLPVIAFKQQVLSTLHAHQLIICIGETGSGKTTQLPQFICDSMDLLGDKGVCAVTQPRRVAAQAVAARVAQERHCTVGDEVGYSVRFDDKTSTKTRIKFMTDGILVRECLSDPLLRAYRVVMLDEAHERSLNTDILFGLVKSVCARRPHDFKVLITSATLNADKFSHFFGGCPVLHIPGRVYPVDIYHSKTRQVMTRSGPASTGYIQAAVEVVMKLHRHRPPPSLETNSNNMNDTSTDIEGEADTKRRMRRIEEGVFQEEGHILVFMTGREDIEGVCAELRAAADQEHSLLNIRNMHRADPGLRRQSSEETFLHVIPLYGALSSEEQKSVFENLSGKYLTHDGKIARIRKCIVATNIAETSITVPHVRFVVDAGFVKQKAFDPLHRIESLVTVPISKVSAAQRAGRSGRTGPGQCYRLYSLDCVAAMMEETVPEIQRTNLANTVLYLKVLGVVDVLGFDFLDPPSEEQLREALVLLHALGAIDAEGVITPQGKQMSHFPVEPAVSKMIAEALAKQSALVLDDVVTIAAMLSVKNTWAEKPLSGLKRKAPGDHSKASQRAQEIEAAQSVLKADRGDHFTLLRVYSEWSRAGATREWCELHFVKLRALKAARNIKEQLYQDAKDMLDTSIAKSRDRDLSNRRREEQVAACIAGGLFMNAARRCSPDNPVFRSCDILTNISSSSGGGGRGDQGVRLLHLHPDSSLGSSHSSEYVVYQEVVHTAKLFMRNVVYVDANTLLTLQRAWKAVSPLVLSARKPPPIDTSAVLTTEPRQPIVSAEVSSIDSQSPTAQIVASKLPKSTVVSARDRYLQRKNAS